MLKTYSEWKKINETIDSTDVEYIKDVFAGLRTALMQASREEPGFFKRIGNYAKDYVARKDAEIRARNYKPSGIKSPTSAQAWSSLLNRESVELLEWQKDAVETLLKAVNDAEKQILDRITSVRNPVGALGSRIDAVPPQYGSSVDTGMPAYRSGRIDIRNPSKVFDIFSTNLPPESLDLMKKSVGEKGDKLSDAFNRIIEILEQNPGRQLRTVSRDVAQEFGMSQHELLNGLDIKFKAGGSFERLFEGKQTGRTQNKILKTFS